jgi:enoyl-[acyl-carrier protein] reductase II
LHSPLHTPICDYFGIEYPIFLAGMGGVSTAPLVAAVSESGGLGVIGAATMGPDELREQIRQTRDLTDKPFAVDLLAPNPDRIRPQVDVMYEEKVEIFVAGLAVPAEFIDEMHSRGMKVVVMCGRVRHAQKSEQAGADVVVAQGTEAGGHTGEIGTLALVPQTVDAVHVPVLAAGGIVDGRGVVACLALGAQGAVIGTRFIATDESQAAQGYRDAIVQAQDDSTMRTRAYTGKPARTIKTDYAEEWETRKDEIQPFPMQAGVSIQNHVMDYMGRTPIFDVHRTFLPAGQGSGGIHAIRPAREVFRDIVLEAEQIIRERFGGAVPSRPA